MRPFSTRAAYPFLVLATIALGACGDRDNLTQVTPRDANTSVVPDTMLHAACTLPLSIGGDAHAATTCTTGGTGGSGGDGSPPPPPPGPLMNWTDFVPTQMDLLSTQTSLEVMVSNFQSPVADAWVSVDVVSNAGTLNVYRVPVSCPNEPQGTLYGNCVFWLWPSAPASTPPSFPAGAANLHVSLTLHAGGGLLGTAPDRWSSITLVDSRTKVTSINPSRQALVIDATAADLYTMTVNNPLSSTRSNMFFRNYVKQNSVVHYSGTASFGCGTLLVSGGNGQIPPGSCTPTAAFNASNTNQSGTLVSGAATFGVQIINGTTGQIEGESTFPVTLNAHPTINALTLSGAAFLGVSPVSQAVVPAADTMVLQYTGSVFITSVTVRDTIIQNGVSHFVGSQSLNCGTGAGVLPTTSSLPGGVCKFTSALTASDPALVTGQATLKKVVLDPVNGVLVTQTVPITIGALPTTGDPILNSTALVIDGAPVGYTAPLNNPGPILSNAMTLNAVLTQSGGVSRIVDSRPVTCGANGTGGMLSGDCSIVGALTVTSAGGTGTLVAGAPTSIEFQLIDNASGAVLAHSFASVSLR